MNVVRRLAVVGVEAFILLGLVTASAYADVLSCGSAAAPLSDCMWLVDSSGKVVVSQSIAEPANEQTAEPAIFFGVSVPVQLGSTDSGLGTGNPAMGAAVWDEDPFAAPPTATHIVILTESEPGSTQRQVSDVIIRHVRFLQTPAGGALLKIAVGMWSDPGPAPGDPTNIFNVVSAAYAKNPGLTNILGIPVSVTGETGAPQNLTGLLFPNATNSGQVWVQSDVNVIPEPRAWMLLTAGLMVGAWQVRRRHIL